MASAAQSTTREATYPAERAQEFGSVHTLIKLHTLSGYLAAYATALKNWEFRLHYIDSFAGNGSCSIRIAGERVEVPGSASIAVDCKPRFDRLVFIEKKPKNVRGLKRLKEANPELAIDIIKDDANAALPAYVQSLRPRTDRAIAFLDPFGMSVRWETLEQVAASQIVDVWYLFPLSGLYRQLSLNAADMDEDKVAALDRILGTHDWYEAFYKQPSQGSLFGGVRPDERIADVNQMVAWVRDRLKKIFADVAEPKILRQVTASGKPGAPLFALFFAVSNPSQKARDLAMRIAKSLLKD